jgi:excisionase family DNA binding protein
LWALVEAGAVIRQRKLDRHRLKIHRSYTVNEAAEALGVHPNTINGWLKAGLPFIATKRDRLILGVDLKAFLEKRDCRRRQTCPPGTMFCMRCRAPRRPPVGLVELVGVRSATLNLRGLCPTCTAVMHRRVARDRLEVAGFGELNVQGAGA